MSGSELSMPAGQGGAAEASPFGITSKKLVMWLFIIADAATFGALLFGYGYLRLGSPDWPRPFAFAPSILNAMIMTVVLLSSSMTMLGAVSAAQKGDRPASVRWLGGTVVLGVTFAALHLNEWGKMIRDGWSLSADPPGKSVQFGAAFFSSSGLHLLHVISGAVAITVVALIFRRGWLTAGHIETMGLYWHFVDLVWMFVFPLMYLMNAR